MNCKPGDLAVVFRFSHTKELLNRFVTVERLHKKGELVSGFNSIGNGGTFWWICKPASGQLLPWTGFEGKTDWVPERTIDDAFLLPIRPGETPEESIEAMRRLTQIPNEVVHG